jgi:hypothetical protein
MMSMGDLTFIAWVRLALGVSLRVKIIYVVLTRWFLKQCGMSVTTLFLEGVVMVAWP